MPIYVTLMPLATSIIAVLVTLLTLYIKERFERTKKITAARAVLLMFTRSLQRVIHLSPESAKHVDIGLVSGFLPEIAIVSDLSSIYAEIEETYLLWKQGSFKERLGSDPLVKRHNDLLTESLTKIDTGLKLLAQASKRV